MEKLIEIVGAALFSLLMLAAAPIVVLMVGALTGYVAAWAMPVTFHMWQVQFGVAAFEPWQIGAMLGFVGAFFRSAITHH